MTGNSHEFVWPKVPEGLRDVAINLPSSFREVCADKSLNNEDLGRLIRCIALDTEAFADFKILGEVDIYLRNARRQNSCRERVRKFREKRKSASCESVTVTPVESVTVTPSSGGAKSDSISIEKTPHNPSEKTPPIVPLKEKSPFPLEKTHRTAGKSAGVSVGQGDLFDLVGASASSDSAEKRHQSAQDGPVAHPDTSNSKIMYPEAGSDSGAVLEPPSGKLTPRDTRRDVSWIPERFSVFWRQYPKKVAKADALKAFTKIVKAQDDVDKFMAVLMASLEWWKRQPGWKKDKGQFIPHPATWLNRGSWKDAEEDQSQGVPQFLSGTKESDEDLIRRMTGG